MENGARLTLSSQRSPIFAGVSRIKNCTRRLSISLSLVSLAVAVAVVEGGEGQPSEVQHDR